MQLGDQRRSGRADRECAQHLTGVFRGGCGADLAGNQVAPPDDAPGGPLGWHAHRWLIHGRDTEVADLVLAAEADIGVLCLREHLMICHSPRSAAARAVTAASVSSAPRRSAAS